MQYVNGTVLGWTNRQVRFGLLGLLCLLLVIAGCATGRNVGKAPVSRAEATATRLTVIHFEGGREGFNIKERASVSAESRADFQQAVVLLKGGSYPQAITMLEKVIDTSPGVAAPYIDMAMAYRHTGQPKQAEKNLKTALQLVPGHPVASNEYGLLLRRSGRFIEARNIYEQALTRFPEYLPVRKNLGILCDLYLGDQACALEQYRIYSEAKPEDEAVKLWIAGLSLHSGAN